MSKAIFGEHVVHCAKLKHQLIAQFSIKTLKLTIKTTLFSPQEFVNMLQIYFCYHNKTKKWAGAGCQC